MNFSDALVALKDGKKVKRKEWDYWLMLFDSRFIIDNNGDKWDNMEGYHILAADWEVIDEI
jgi:hypothetical protein